MSGVGVGDDGDEDDGLGDLSGPLPTVEFVKHGLELTPTVVAASHVAVSIPVDRGLSAAQALRQFNEVTAGWANRAKTPTIFTLLKFVVGFCNGTDEDGAGALSFDLPPVVTDKCLLAAHVRLVSQSRGALGLPASRQTAYLLFCKDFRAKFFADNSGAKPAMGAVTAAWKSHLLEGAGESALYAVASAENRERYLREHELWQRDYHGSDGGAGEMEGGGGGGGGEDGGVGGGVGAAAGGGGGEDEVDVMDGDYVESDDDDHEDFRLLGARYDLRRVLVPE